MKFNNIDIRNIVLRFWKLNNNKKEILILFDKFYRKRKIDKLFSLNGYINYLI